MPLLGSYGGSSEYAYRGTIDDFPNDFSFTNQTNAIPGDLLTSNQVTITGINNRALVRVSAGASVSINGGSYVIPTEASPVFIKNNETLSVRIQSTSGQISDFNKLYSANVSVGRKTALWEVRTKIVDVDPTPFTFTNQTNREIGVGYTSNEVTISGLESGFPFLAEITSGDGQIIKNGGTGVPTVDVVNGDRIYLRLISPFEYSNNPTGSGTRTNSTTVRVGSYSTSWSVSSRDVDIFVDPFDFPDVNNALVSSVYTSQSTNPSGIVTTITGADQGIPLVTAVTGCELQVEQPAAGGGFNIRRPFSTANALVFNGDKLTARITTGTNFSEAKIGIVTVSNIRAQFIVTTRPRPVDTIPDAFTFTDVNVNRGETVESNEITLVGMTTFTDEGDASITTGTNGGNAQFQVTRGTQIIKPFSATGSKVRNGDKIKLKITASSDQNITRTATFRVDGTDTRTIITGQTGFRDDIWSVVSAARNCDIAPFTLSTVNGVDRNSLQTTTFTVSGFQTDCGMIVSTSGGGSSLSVSGSSLTNNIPVTPGTVVTLRMPASSSFGSSTVATVTVSNTPSGVLPNKSYTTTWTVNTTQDNTPTSVTLTANPTSISPNQSSLLTWTTVNAATITSFSGEGFNPTNPQGGNITVFPTTQGTISYSISVQGPPSASNFPTSVPAFASITVTEDTTPDSFSLSPSSFTDQDKNFEVSATATVSGLGQNVSVFASISGSASGFSVNGGSRVTQQQVRNGDSIRVFMTTSQTQNTSVTGTLNIGTQSSSFTATTKACSATPTSSSPISGVTLNFISAKIRNQNGTITENVNLYTSRTGSSLFQECKPGTAGASDYKATTTTLDVPLPAGVTQIEVAAVGPGGIGDLQKGGGGGAFARATFTAPTITGGQTINLSASGNATIKLNSSTTLLTAGAGTRGLLGGQGGTFSVSPSASSSTGQNGTAGSLPGGPAGGGGSAGGQAGSGQFIGGGGGGGKTLSPAPGGGIKEDSVNGQDAFTAGGATGTPQGAPRGGGGGGASNQLNPVTKKVAPGPSTSGGSGIAVVFYSAQASPGTTWDQLIQRIVSTYLNGSTGVNRPPTDTELNSRINDFRTNTSLTLDGLEQQIKNSLSSQTKATSYTDICETSFTPS